MTEKLFHITGKESNIRTELLAGMITFITMAYILMVNVGIVAALPGVSYGIAFGIISHVLIVLFTGKRKELTTGTWAIAGLFTVMFLVTH